LKRNDLLNRVEYAAFRIFLWKMRLLPYKAGRSVVTWLFVAIGYGLGIRRETAELHLRNVYPDLDDTSRKQLLKNIYRNMGLTVAELYLQNEQDLIRESTISGKAHAEKALSLNRGAILATAHFGNWEAARILPLYGIPLSVVVKQQHNPYFDRYNTAIRTRQGVAMIDFRKGLRDILKHLYNNEMVAILADQNAGRSGLVLDFLGFPASHWKGVAKISLRYKVPIVPAFALRTPEGTIKFCFEPMIYHPELEDTEENYVFILKKLDEVIESYIDRYPEQWFWVHKRWKATGAMREGIRNHIKEEDE
jgi:KDO2-lipid IV(A) lauroyltransferase